MTFCCVLSIYSLFTQLQGIKLLLGGSFSETYKRNALNNGFLCVEVPALVRDIKSKFGTTKLTVLTGLNAAVDFVNSRVTVDNKTYSIGSIGKTAQELILKGGLEPWVKASLAAKKSS